MPRRAGQVMKRTRTDSTVYALRFNVQGRGQYVTLGSSKDGLDAGEGTGRTPRRTGEGAARDVEGPGARSRSGCR